MGYILIDVFEPFKSVYAASTGDSGGTYQTTQLEQELAAGTLAESETDPTARISTTESDTDTTEPDPDHKSEYNDHQLEGDHRDIEIEQPRAKQQNGEVKYGCVVIVLNTNIGDCAIVELH